MPTDCAAGQSDAMALAEQLRHSVGRFVRSMRATTNSERSAQSETLDLLEREGEMNVAALATRRNVTHQTMRVVVGQLEADGLVERLPDPTDGRSLLVALSARGREAVGSDRSARATRIGMLIERNLSDRERRQLHASIELIDRLSAAAST